LPLSHPNIEWEEVDDEMPERTAMLVWLAEVEDSHPEAGIATFGRLVDDEWQSPIGDPLEIDGWKVTHWSFEPSGPLGPLSPPNYEGDGKKFETWFAARDLLRMWHERRCAGLIDDPRDAGS
jgi:hypothetical protein